MTDLVYLVRRGDVNHELRMSLRSLIHAPHDRVWIVGHKPLWVQGVEFIKGNRFKGKPLNVFDNVRLACAANDMPQRFVVMNDDFYLYAPLDLRPVFRCTLDEHLAILAKRNDSWSTSMNTTKTWLADQGVTAPLSYELHIPIQVDKDLMGDVLARAATAPGRYPPQWRTVYGNLHIEQAAQMSDCKVRHGTNLDTLAGRAVASSSDATFPRIRPLLKSLYPARSPYEK